MTYKQWTNKVDQVMISVFGLGHSDLPDALWRDKFEDGLSPVEAIESTVDDEWADLPEMADVWFSRDSFDRVGDIDVFRV